jgi:L-lactate utilization protein LutC
VLDGPGLGADIERVGAIGVHGPLSVHIILVEA